jgi:hypothetical protein
MQTYCDRCNEHLDHPINITEDAELAVLAKDLGYRNVCSGCYDDLLSEAAETRELHGDEQTRRSEERISVGLPLHFEPADGSGSRQRVITEDISASGLRVRAVERLERGSVVRIAGDGASDVDAVAIVEVVWHDDDGLHAGLRLVEPSESWARLVECNLRRDVL